MPKKVPLDRLAGELSAILADYADDITEGTAEAVQAAAKTAQKALRSTSPRMTGEYAKSWRVEVERNNVSTSATVYSTKPGLPHLLEFGHVSRNASGDYGNVDAHPHIENVERQVVDDFEKAVREVIQK